MKPIRWSSLMSFYDVRSRVLLSATFCKRSANSKLKRTYDKVEVIKDEANEFKLVLEHIQNEFQLEILDRGLLILDCILSLGNELSK